MNPMALAPLQRAALNDLHPHWLPQLEATLIERARGSALGRRELSQRLADAGIALFARVAADADELEVLARLPWLLQPLHEQQALLLDLGSSACSAALRAIVARDEVLRLRRVLGEPRYRQLLTQAARPRGTRLPAEAVDSDEALQAHLCVAGASALSKHLPTPIAERVKLAFGPASIDLIAADLPPDEIEQQLSAHRLAGYGAAA